MIKMFGHLFGLKMILLLPATGKQRVGQEPRKVYFAMKFSKPFKSYGHKKYDKVHTMDFTENLMKKKISRKWQGKKIRAYFNFDMEEGEKIKIKFAFSSVSTAGALKNLEAEIPHWDFEKTKRNQRKME